MKRTKETYHQDMTWDFYKSRVIAIKEKFGWPPIGYLEYKLNISAKYAQALLDSLNTTLVVEVDRTPLSVLHKTGKISADTKFGDFCSSHS